jgi:DNA modification methylase
MTAADCEMPHLFHKTHLGAICLADSSKFLVDHVEEHSVDLIVTSPPYGLVRKKEYGNVDAEEYLEWFRPFAHAFKRVLKEKGSLIIDIGGAWNPGLPTRSLYHFKLMIMLCEEFGFHLAQDFYWWNPSRLPTPAEWVTVRRIRVKDAIDCVWWLSPSPWPRASNRRVLQPYSSSMRDLLRNGYRAKRRPSGHDISEKFAVDNGASIPPNLIAVANTESNSFYLRYCRDNGIKPHPARYPAHLPEFFIRMLTDRGDLVVDPFAGSCVTGEVCERLGRRWLCIDTSEEYLRGALGRFIRPSEPSLERNAQVVAEDESLYYDDEALYYQISRPGVLWGALEDHPLPSDGGKKRQTIARCRPVAAQPAEQEPTADAVQLRLLKEARQGGDICWPDQSPCDSPRVEESQVRS